MLRLEKGWLIVTDSRGFWEGIFVSEKTHETRTMQLPQGEEEAHRKIVNDAISGGLAPSTTGKIYRFD